LLLVVLEAGAALCINSSLRLMSLGREITVLRIADIIVGIVGD
jgi:hypothetical protein